MEEAAENYINGIRHQLHLGEEESLKHDLTSFASEVIEHPWKYGLRRGYEYTALVDQVGRLTATLRDVDDLLMTLEDHVHGKDGNKITELRGEIKAEMP